MQQNAHNRTSKYAPSVTTPKAGVEDLNVNDPEHVKRKSRKRDEAIRKKVGKAINTVTSKTTGTSVSKNALAGSVASLKVNPAFTVTDTTSVLDAALLMAAQRVDALLVSDSTDTASLIGIATDKDFAFKVVASGLNSRTTKMRDIMTREPLCVTCNESATKALSIMASGKFRHLPVLNENGEVFGMLDITVCLYHAMSKIERAYASSKTLHEALESHQREWGTAVTPNLMHVDKLLMERMCCPEVSTIIDDKIPVIISLKTLVKEAVVEMHNKGESGLLVLKDDGTLAGIFTTKDIVLRVLASKLDPETTSIVRVMTPHPDVVPPETTVLESLRLMHERHFLHLPVLEHDGAIVGLVDVLRLTYSTLDQINKLEMGPESAGLGESNSGPIWDRFWNSAFSVGDAADKSEYLSDATSGYMERERGKRNNVNGEEVASPQTYTDSQSNPYSPIVGENEFTRENDQRTSNLHIFNDKVNPIISDSIEVGSIHQPILEGTSQPYQSVNHFLKTMEPVVSLSERHGRNMSRNSQYSLINGNSFTYKIRSQDGSMQRFIAPADNIEVLKQIVTQKLQLENENYSLSYNDEDNDEINLKSDDDLLHAITSITSRGGNKLLLIYQKAEREKAHNKGALQTSEERTKKVDNSSLANSVAVATFGGLFLGACAVGMTWVYVNKYRR